MTAAWDASTSGDWLVDEDDFGEPMVSHRLTLGDVVACIGSTPNTDLIQCTDCMQYLSLNGTQPAAEPSRAQA